jgi:hypothetical protein
MIGLFSYLLYGACYAGGYGSQKHLWAVFEFYFFNIFLHNLRSLYIILKNIFMDFLECIPENEYLCLSFIHPYSTAVTQQFGT